MGRCSFIRLPDVESGAIVLGADTIVVRRGMLLGKPKDSEDAIRMLRGLRGERHFVVTGHVLVRRRGGEVQTLHTGATISARRPWLSRLLLGLVVALSKSTTLTAIR